MTLPRRPNIENFPQKSNQTASAALRSEFVSGRYSGIGLAQCRIANHRNFCYIFPDHDPFRPKEIPETYYGSACRRRYRVRENRTGSASTVPESGIQAHLERKY